MLRPSVLYDELIAIYMKWKFLIGCSCAFTCMWVLYIYKYIYVCVCVCVCVCTCVCVCLCVCVYFRIHIERHWSRTSTTLNILWYLYLQKYKSKYNNTYINLNIAFTHFHILMQLYIYLYVSGLLGSLWGPANSLFMCGKYPVTRRLRRKAEVRITYHLTPELAVNNTCFWFNGDLPYTWENNFDTTVYIQQ